MRPPHLDEEVSYFKIPPHVPLSDLEEAIMEAGLNSNDSIKDAIFQAQLTHSNEPRHSKAPVLEEHIYPVALSVLEYQKFQKQTGNPQFATLNPDAVVVALTHDIPDEEYISMREFKRIFGTEISEMVYPLTDLYYLPALRGSLGKMEEIDIESGRAYRLKIEMKFEKLRTSPWQTQIAGLADRLNQLLCYYTPPYLNEKGKPTERMARGISIATDIALPFAKSVSPDFFYPMFEELMTHYRKEYPNLFTAK